MNLNSISNPTKMQIVAGFAKRNFTPRIVTAFQKYKKSTKYRIPPRAGRQLRKDLGLAGAKTVFSFLFYEATARAYGVSARDSQLSFQAEEAWGDTSSFSLKIAGYASAKLIPFELKETIAGAIIPVEVGLSILRMYVEQKVWTKLGVTPDPAGTLLTPYMAGIMELAYKATVKYPQDPETRLMVGLVGIYGNIIRMLHAGAFAFVGKLLSSHERTVN